MSTDPSLPKPIAPLARVMRDRRQFLSGGGAMLAGGTIWNAPALADVSLSLPPLADKKPLRVGLVGCGQRGTAAAMELLGVEPNVQIVAMADPFANQLQSSYRALNGRHPSKVQVNDHRFLGADAAVRLIQSDLDALILATPPWMAPKILTQSARHGKHVWLHSEPGIDDFGFRESIEASRLFDQAGLSVVCSAMRSDTARIKESLEMMVQGAIGEPISATILWSLAMPRQRESNGAPNDVRLRNWQLEPRLAGPAALRGTIAGWEVLHRWMGDRNFIPVDCREVSAVGHRMEIELLGTLGSCNPISGIVRDSDGCVVWRSTSKGEASPSTTRWIQSIIKAQPHNDLLHFVQSARSALASRPVDLTLGSGALIAAKPLS